MPATLSRTASPRAGFTKFGPTAGIRKIGPVARVRRCTITPSAGNRRYRACADARERQPSSGLRKYEPVAAGGDDA